VIIDPSLAPKEAISAAQAEEFGDTDFVGVVNLGAVRRGIRRTSLSKQTPQSLLLYGNVQINAGDADIGMARGISDFGERSTTCNRVTNESAPAVANCERCESFFAKRFARGAEPLPKRETLAFVVNQKVSEFRRQNKSSPGRTRTYDPAVNSRLLYQLSYQGMFCLRRLSG
jgi:hypothetical protein